MRKEKEKIKSSGDGMEINRGRWKKKKKSGMRTHGDRGRADERANERNSHAPAEPRRSWLGPCHSLLMSREICADRKRSCQLSRPIMTLSGKDGRQRERRPVTRAAPQPQRRTCSQAGKRTHNFWRGAFHADVHDAALSPGNAAGGKGREGKECPGVWMRVDRWSPVDSTFVSKGNKEGSIKA